MFGSCGNNLKCGIGEIAISKITIMRTQKEIAYYTRPSDVESSIDLTDVRLLRGISFSQRRDLNYISYDRRSSIVTSGEQFSPERLSLQIISFQVKTSLLQNEGTTLMYAITMMESQFS